LAKAIASAFIIHGIHFSVLRQIHPNDVHDFHITSIDYIARKVSAYVKQEKATKVKDAKTRAMQKRFQALSFFRVLLLLLGPITGKDALRIKSHLEDVMGETGAPVSVNKAWDAYRIYEKKLVLIASKDPNVKVAASKRVAAETGDEVESPRKSVRAPAVSAPTVDDDEDEDEEGGSPAPPPKRSGRQPVVTTEAEHEEEEDDEEDAANGHEDSLSPAPSTPAKRPLEVDRGLSFEPMADVDLNLDIDFDLDLDPEGSQDTSRARSVSIEPTAKKRKTVRRF